MKSKSILTAILATGTLSLAALTSNAAIIGGVDPATAPGAFESDSANTFMVISNQFTHTTTASETIDLSLSSFNYQSNGHGAAAATPFLALLTGAPNSHNVADYDVIWVGSSLAKAASGIDVSGALGAGTFVLPASSTVVGGFFGSDAGTLSPVSAVFAGGTANDVLVIAQSTIDVATDITVTGSDWSTNPAVTNRLYHYQIDLQPVPEPSVGLLFGLAGICALVRRRR